MAKITMQDIADALQTSRVTVWKAFNNRDGVSQELREQILQKAKEMGYNKYTADSPPAASKHNIVSLVVSRPDTSIFWMNIIHQIAKELSKNNIDLIYTYLPTFYSDGYTLPGSLSDGTTSGCIILNVYDLQLTKMLNDLDIPKIFLDIVPAIPVWEIRGDLFLLEGAETIRRLVSDFIELGYRRFGFIGDINYAKTNSLRYEGFITALSEHHMEINPSCCMLLSQANHHYEEDVFSFLDNLQTMPEVFICVNDYVAHVVNTYFASHGISVPDDVIITGYDGTAEHDSHSNMSATVLVDTTVLGKRLARQFIFRLENPVGCHEVIYIISNIIHPSPCPRR
ncbi:MAG: LacI family DNA-binding transcriptional regulator [Eubacteriales bacterium]|nr:LacI family DNA-binding transcriptional regulator [Eubacteriales bacterium]